MKVVEGISDFGVSYNKEVTVSLKRIDELISNKLYLKMKKFGNIDLTDNKGAIN